MTRALDLVDDVCRAVFSRLYAVTRTDAVRVMKDGAASPAEIARCWRQETPLLLRGGATHWPAVQRWTPDYLARTLHGTIGVGCSRTGVFQTRTTAILQMDAREAIEAIMLSSDPDRRYYLKNVPLRSSSFAPLAGDLGPLRMLPADATDVGGSGAPGSLFWMGQQGTVTPLHADPTPNIVVSILGTKVFTLISPAWTRDLYPESVSSTAFWYSRLSDIRGVDPRRFPRFARVRPHRVELRPGDVLCIPAGWWHHVENTSVVASVNYFFRSATAWPFARRQLNPNTWHFRLARLVDQVRIARFLRHGGSGAEAEQFDVYVRMLSLDALRHAFAGYKKSRNPLFRWALAPYRELEATPLYRRYLELSRESTQVK